jgi:hypothetical protein
MGITGSGLATWPARIYRTEEQNRPLMGVMVQVQVQVQVCFTSVCGQVQPLDVALNNSV